jgi:Uma2 family endonuclease
MGALRTLVTAEQLLNLPDVDRAELVKGEIVEMSPVGLEHWDLVGRIVLLVGSFVTTNKLGFFGTEGGFILGRDPDTVRAPDFSFVAAHRLSGTKGVGFGNIAPDLAVEVLSPNDRASEINAKIAEYFHAGTRLVWVVDPRTEQVLVYHPSGQSRVYTGDQEISGEDVLPGFSFRPADLFLA